MEYRIIPCGLTAKTLGNLKLISVFRWQTNATQYELGKLLPAFNYRLYFPTETKWVGIFSGHLLRTFNLKIMKTEFG